MTVLFVGILEHRLKTDRAVMEVHYNLPEYLDEEADLQRTKPPVPRPV